MQICYNHHESFYVPHILGSVLSGNNSFLSVESSIIFSLEIHSAVFLLYRYNMVYRYCVNIQKALKSYSCVCRSIFEEKARVFFLPLPVKYPSKSSNLLNFLLDCKLHISSLRVAITLPSLFLFFSSRQKC